MQDICHCRSTHKHHFPDLCPSLRSAPPCRHRRKARRSRRSFSDKHPPCRPCLPCNRKHPYQSAPPLHPHFSHPCDTAQMHRFHPHHRRNTDSCHPLSRLRPKQCRSNDRCRRCSVPPAPDTVHFSNRSNTDYHPWYTGYPYQQLFPLGSSTHTPQSQSAQSSQSQSPVRRPFPLSAPQGLPQAVPPASLLPASVLPFPLSQALLLFLLQKLLPLRVLPPFLQLLPPQAHPSQMLPPVSAPLWFLLLLSAPIPHFFLIHSFPSRPFWRSS